MEFTHLCVHGVVSKEGKTENNGFYVIICERKRSINSTDLKEITNEIDEMLNN